MKSNIIATMLLCLLLGACNASKGNSINLDSLLKCGDYDFRESYFTIPYNGCIYNPKKANDFGNTTIYLLPAKGTAAFNEHLIQIYGSLKNNDLSKWESARVNALSKEGIRKEFIILCFVIDSQYLDYYQNGELSYVPKNKYLVKAYKSAPGYPWHILDSFPVNLEVDIEKERQWEQQIINANQNPVDKPAASTKTKISLNPALYTFDSFTVSCTAQLPHHSTHTTPAMRRFDIDFFNKHAVNNEYRFTDTMGANIRLVGGGNDYTEEISAPNSPYEIVYNYYADGSLWIEAKSFKGVTVGVFKEYNKEGKLIMEFNHEKDFPFTIEALAAVVQKEYGPHLLDKEPRPRVVLERRLKPSPIYLVKWRDPESHLLRVAIYDGATGKKIREDQEGGTSGPKQPLAPQTPGATPPANNKQPGRRFNIFD